MTAIETAIQTDAETRQAAAFANFRARVASDLVALAGELGLVSSDTDFPDFTLTDSLCHTKARTLLLAAAGDEEGDNTENWPDYTSYRVARTEAGFVSAAVQIGLEVDEGGE